MARRKKATALIPSGAAAYGGLVTGIADLLDQARRGAARAINSVLTATYWEIGRRIVEFEQGGKARAEYGDELLKRLGKDLSAWHGRGFSHQGLYKMRAFYLGWQIFPTASGKLRPKCDCRRRYSRQCREYPQEQRSRRHHLRNWRHSEDCPRSLREKQMGRHCLNNSMLDCLSGHFLSPGPITSA